MNGTDPTHGDADGPVAPDTEPVSGEPSEQEATMALTHAETTTRAEPEAAPAPAPGEPPPLAPGTLVEVRSSFERTWSKGFEVVDQTDGRYRIRRLSDASVLPGTFARTDLRRERRTGTWWY